MGAIRKYHGNFDRVCEARLVGGSVGDLAFWGIAKLIDPLIRYPKIISLVNPNFYFFTMSNKTLLARLKYAIFYRPGQKAPWDVGRGRRRQ